MVTKGVYLQPILCLLWVDKKRCYHEEIGISRFPDFLFISLQCFSTSRCSNSFTKRNSNSYRSNTDRCNPCKASDNTSPATTITSKPINTQLPAVPTLSELASPIGDPTNLDDTTYKAYLGEQFNRIGDNTIALEGINIRHDRLAGRNSTDVNFNIGDDEASASSKNTTQPVSCGLLGFYRN